MRLILGYIMYISGIMAGIILHCYTVYWVYGLHGMMWAFISLIAPPFSELIMAGASIGLFGWMNWYLLSWFGVMILFKIGEMMLQYEADKLGVSNVNQEVQ